MKDIDSGGREAKECPKDSKTVSRRTVNGILITKRSSCLQNSC